MGKIRFRKRHGLIQLMLIFSLTAVLTLIVSTFAYFEDAGAAENFLDTGIFKVDLIDDFENDRLTLPGDTVSKDVSMKNNGTYDAVVRIKLDPSWTPAVDGAGNPLLTDKVTVTYGTNIITDWTYFGGWYYYNKILPPAQATSLLVDALKLEPVSNDLHRTDYSAAKFNLNIQSESLQAQAEAAQENWSASYIVSGSALIWSVWP